MKIVFEQVACHRCDGLGRLEAFGHVHGGRCFKCGGAGKVMTAAGKRAYSRVLEVQKRLCTKAASEVEVGEKILRDGRFRKVLEVKTALGKGNGISKMGVEGTDSYCEFWTYGQTMIKTTAGALTGPAHYEVTVAWTPETIAVAADAVKKLKGAEVFV